MIEKICNDCKEKLPLTGFGKDQSQADGKMRRCYRCHSNYVSRLTRYKKNPELVAALLERANHHCQICGKELLKFCIDHDHKTGEVRGVLCFSCNQGLGVFKDDPNILLNAVIYLQGKHK